MEPIQLAAVLAGVIVLASVLSVELGLSVALLEPGLGVAFGNLLHLDPDQEWLTFMASLIAGTALSTTSLAVVYAVLVETGLNATRIGKLIMSACFVTDMGTALALSAIFIKPNGWFPLFLAVSILSAVAIEEPRRKLRQSLGVLALLVTAKMAPKIGLILPLARRAVPAHATFTTLLMSTGLTFDTISALYGLDHRPDTILAAGYGRRAVGDRATAIAQRCFSPDVEAEKASDRAARQPPVQPLPAGDQG